MSKTLLEKSVNFPDQPGVYMFMANNKPVYIGKATSLRDRIRSYFNDDLRLTRTLLVQKAVDESDDIEYQTTDSVLEALILEANLIKKYKPLGNTALMDDKSFNYVVFTDEEYPRVFTVRAHDLSTKYDPDEFKYVFGPYTSRTSLKKALKLIRKIFPFRGQKDRVQRRDRVDSPLNEQIGLVPNFEKIQKRDYQLLVNNLRLFFEGKKSKLIKDLNKQMKSAAKEMEFEQAAKLRNTIYALEHINDTSLISEEFIYGGEENPGIVIESYDIAHTMGENMVGVMVVMENGIFNKSRYRKFKIRKYKSSNDTGALKEMFHRRLNHNEWPLPDIFVVDGGQAQYNVYSSILQKVGISIPVVSVVKGQGHKPKGFIGDQDIIQKYEDDILRANIEAHRFAITWHRSKQRKDRFEI